MPDAFSSLPLLALALAFGACTAPDHGTDAGPVREAAVGVDVVDAVDVARANEGGSDTRAEVVLDAETDTAVDAGIDVTDVDDVPTVDTAPDDAPADVAVDVQYGAAFCTLGADVAGAMLPPGFCIRRFATVPSARVLAFTPEGGLFVSAPANLTPGGAPRGAGAIYLLEDSDRDGSAETYTYLANVSDVHGIAVRAGFLYYTTALGVWRVPYAAGLHAAPSPAELVATFHPGDPYNFRWTHGLAFASDGTLYATQGNFGSTRCPPTERDGAVNRVVVPHCAEGCSAPWQSCPAAGGVTACVDLQNDPRNCGSCGAACAPGQACFGGACQSACAPGYLACGTDCVDAADDSRACGACNAACGAGAHCAGMDVEVSGFRNPMYIRCHPTRAVCLASELSDDNDAFGAPEKLFVVRPGTAGYPCCVDRNAPSDGLDPGNAYFDCSNALRAESTVPLHDTPFGTDWERGLWPAPYRGAVFVALHGSAYGAPAWVGTRVQYAPADPSTLAPGTGWTDFLTGFGPGGSSLDRAADVAFAPDGRMFLADDQGGAVYWIAPTDLRAALP